MMMTIIETQEAETSESPADHQRRRKIQGFNL